MTLNSEITRSSERIKETGEVFTPDDLVNKVLDKLDSSVWTDPTKTWLEPSCGDGNFLVVVHARLMAGLAEAIPQENDRHRHIIENMIFAVDLMQDNIDMCINRLDATGLKHNIVCADGTTYNYRFGRDEFFGNDLFKL